MIKFGIIGCGKIAQRHAEHINNKASLICVCDINEKNADNLGDLYSADTYYSIDQMLNSKPDIDVISICTPNGLHAEHTVKCLNAGYHVICEKPMAINSNDCKTMIDAVESSGRQLFVVKQNRYNPAVVAVKDVIDRGILGKIFSVQVNCFWNRKADYYADSWHGSTDLDGGTLYTQFSHFIDLLYWLIGDVKESSGYASNYMHEGMMEFEDTGAVTLIFENDCIGTLNYTVNSFKKNMEGSLTIFAENGTVKIGGEYLNELVYQNIQDHKIAEIDAGNIANHYGSYSGSMSNHDKVYDNVLEVLLHNGTATTSAFEAMKTVQIIENIYKSIKKV